MNDKKRLNSYEDLPLVLDVADIQWIMGISRASAYELVHTIAFFEWMAKGSETVPGSDK
ncbi:DNA-binding protein [Blautia massiliensis (ex Durand et al. 2017)]|uniref:DNA-binding protein n=1 Tax=Blautia massiliensis (ex Durand et al. 2017) TaxID=1737424 RepID=UPI0022E681FC|nr:DNA-binding protein [Blautia massiliensis (ex Durand et al. 2017)]